jgi:hypothetical protein
MRGSGRLLVLVLLAAQAIAARGQNAKALVQQNAKALVQQNAKELVQLAVQTELAASRDDHSRWLYYEIDRKPGSTVEQWVAETGAGSIRRVIRENGQPLPLAEQRQRMDRFVQDTQAQARQRKSGQHDDKQAAEMLRLLPGAFVWTITGANGNSTMLHFRPDPNFEPPGWETRVFAAMEGDMEVDNRQHRIVSLKGRLIHSVKFFFGLFGNLKSGGTFDVERRETGPSIWQITATHVHIQGTALLFKNISQIEDDEKTQFKPLPADITLPQAEIELLKQGE